MTSINANDIGFIIGIIGIISVLFAIYNKFRKPQEDIETKQAVAEKDIANKATILAQKELETKALVLAEQVKSKNEENERRFLDMGVRLDTAMTTAQNHIHTVDIKVDKLIESVNVMGNKITELSTIINERIPKKS
jgi:hypothetical protein